MKQFACGSVVAGCNAVFRAESEEELLAQVADHAHCDHEVHEVTEALVETIRENITPVAA